MVAITKKNKQLRAISASSRKTYFARKSITHSNRQMFCDGGEGRVGKYASQI